MKHGCLKLGAKSFKATDAAENDAQRQRAFVKEQQPADYRKMTMSGSIAQSQRRGVRLSLSVNAKEREPESPVNSLSGL